MRRCGAYVQRTRTSRKYGLPQPYEPSKSKFNVTKFIAKIGPNKCERGECEIHYYYCYHSVFKLTRYTYNVTCFFFANDQYQLK